MNEYNMIEHCGTIIVDLYVLELSISEHQQYLATCFAIPCGIL
jgi:hypothetical protein